MYKKILVPLDGSVLSEAIIPHAETIAKAMDAEVVFVYVIPTPVPEFSTQTMTPSIKIFQEAEEEMKIYLKKECLKLENEGVRTNFLIREGAVAETILDAAESIQAGMIAMSTHGRTGAQRLLFGSVTEQTVHQSPLPVMVIRPKF